mgnify:CR=1 FL=1
MGSFNDLNQLRECKASGANLLRDPGNGGTLYLPIDDGLCLLTLAAAGETRALRAAADVPLGVRVTVVVDQITGGGTCTMEGITFSVEGERATFECHQYNGARAWYVRPGSPGSVTATDLVLNSTYELNFTFGGVSALAMDDAAIVSNVAAAGSDGKSLFMETQDGAAGNIVATPGLAGGNFTVTAGIGGAAYAGSGDVGGDSACISLVTQAGGAGDGAGAAGLAGVIRLNSAPGVIFEKHALTTKTTTATLTAAELLGGLLSTTGTSYTVTLPSGADLDNAIHAQVGANEYFEFSVVNTASGTVTIAVGSGNWTSLGTLTVATLTSARFRVTRTAVSTFVLYRVG